MTTGTASIRFYSTRDGKQLATRVWAPANAMSDVILLHGIVSHGGWYLPSCQYLADHGHTVHFLERRGSGLNSSEPGDIDDWTTWMNDIQDYLASLPTGRPRILLGISWGGILASAFARYHGDQIDALGLICPGVCSRRAANAAQRIGLQVASRLGLSNRKVDIPLKEAWLFTQSPKSQTYVDNDPLRLRKITIRFAVHNQTLLREATAHPEEINVPVLLILAGDDPIVDNPATRQFVERTSHPNRQVIEYSNTTHTLEFEDDPSEYFRDLDRWCRAVVAEPR